jgi:hypothetical protein
LRAGPHAGLAIKADYIALATAFVDGKRAEVCRCIEAELYLDSMEMPIESVRF